MNTRAESLPMRGCWLQTRVEHGCAAQEIVHSRRAATEGRCRLHASAAFTTWQLRVQELPRAPIVASALKRSGDGAPVQAVSH